MPRPKPAKMDRKCLVCGGITSVAHLGFDICRACTVFYRRARTRKFACRTNTNNCTIGDGVNCRKCRLAEMERLMSRSQTNRVAALNERAQPISRETYRSNGHAEAHIPIASPSTSSSDHYGDISKKQQSRELLTKLQKCYRAMCEKRLAGELASRKDPPHPLAVVDGKFDITPATYAGMDVSNRLLLTALLQFGASAFEEFGTFSGKDRWTLVTNYFTRYRLFEADYRADKCFTNDMTKNFAGYTMYFSKEVPEHFFDDCPTEGVFKEDAKKTLLENLKRGMHGSREHMRSVKLSHEEFLAVLALMFWDTEGIDVSEEVSRASHVYKDTILKELHSYYSEEIKLHEYATRLGELLMMLQVYEQRSRNLDEHFEMMRLLNVFSDDTLIYRLE